MKNILFGIALGLAVLTAACGQKAEAPISSAANETVPATEAMKGDMGNMAMPAGAKMAKGSGNVTAIDTAAGKITLDHGPIPEAGWPAMTMAFDAKPNLLQGVVVGDKVAFELAIKGGGGEVTAIHKQ